MSNQVIRGLDVESAAPQRVHIGWLLLAFALVVAPAAWFGQLLVGYGLASHSCYPNRVPLDEPVHGLAWVWWLVIALNLAAIAASVVAAAVALRNLRLSRGDPSAHSASGLIEPGKARNTFLGIFGVWTGVWFLIAVAFDTIMVFWVPLCGIS
jgi:hypothetical protein